MTTGKELLDRYEDYQVTLALLGPTTNEAKWVDSRVLPDLRSAAKVIIADEQKHAPYLMMVHTPGEDINLSQEDFDLVIREVASES